MEIRNVCYYTGYFQNRIITSTSLMSIKNKSQKYEDLHGKFGCYCN